MTNRSYLSLAEAGGKSGLVDLFIIGTRNNIATHVRNGFFPAFQGTLFNK